MNKRKNTNKDKNLQYNQETIQPFLPNWLIYFIFTIWIWFSLSNYFKVIISNSFISFFQTDETLFLSSFNKRLLEHIVNIVCAVSIFIAAYGLGCFLIKYIKKILNIARTSKDINELIDSNSKPDLLSETLINLFFNSVLGLGVLALNGLLIGILGLLFKPVIFLLIGFLGLYGIIKLQEILTIRLPKFSFLERIAIGLLLLISFINLIGALAPELFYDSQYYQLGMINKWINDHKIESNKYMMASYFPLNVNMLYMIGMIINNEITAKLIHFFCGLMLTLGVYALSKKYFNQKTAVFAALIFYSVPQVMTVSWKTAIELGIGIFEFGFIFALLNYFVNKKIFWLVISGILCGFSLGCKYTSITFCFFPALLTIVFAGFLQKDKKRDILKNLIIFSLCALIISMPWYLRNIITTGNPVFPFLGDKIGFGQLRVASNTFLSDPQHPKFTFLNYFLFIWPLTLGALQQESFPGSLFLVLAPLLFLFKNIDRKIKTLIIYIAGSIIFWIVFGRFYLRYFIPTISVISIIFSYYVVNQKTDKVFRNGLLCMLILLAFNNLTFSTSILKITQDPFPYVTGSQSRKDYLSTQRPSFPCPYYQTLEFANTKLDKKAKILFLGETRGLYCQRRFLAQGSGDFSPLMEWTKTSQSDSELYSRFNENGVTHILLNVPEAKRLSVYDIFYWDRRDVKIFNDFWKKYVKEIYRDVGDIAVPQQGIYSVKQQQPQFWQRYISDAHNYVYLYEILPQAQAEKPHDIPYNFLLE